VAFIDQWEQALPESFAAFVQHPDAIGDINLDTGVLPAAVLWPLRLPVQEFDENAIAAVREILGDAAGRVLKIIGAWPHEPIVAARDLADQAAKDPALLAALGQLNERFNSRRHFAEQLARQYAPKLGGDTFNVAGQIEAALVNIGGTTNIKELNVALNMPTIGVPPMSWRRRVAVGIVGLVLLASAALVIYQFVEPRLRPRPKMTGAFNIAVAEFGGLDAAGNVVDSEPARNLSEAVYRTINTEIEASIRSGAFQGFNIQVMSPSQTGQIEGALPEQRMAVAKRMAKDRDIDVIIYGNLALGRETTGFVPEFYLSDRTLENAEELVGQYSFGRQVETPGDALRNPTVSKTLGDILSARTKALAQFVIGLGYYATDQFDKAAANFTAAEQIQGWDEADGKQVLYLFMGNAANKQSMPNRLSKDERQRFLDQARDYYERSLSIEPEYSRGWIGKAEVRLLTSRGADCAASTADVAGLQEAIDGFKRALTAREQPPGAAIHTKVAFGLGRSYLCLSHTGAAKQWIEAEQELKEVVADYEQDQDDRVKKILAAEAHADLGLLYWWRPADNATWPANFQLAIAQYRAAIDLSLYNDRKSTFYFNLGQLYDSLGQYDQADSAFADAIRLHTNEAQKHIFQQYWDQYRRERPSTGNSTSGQ
jgi:tetratricopeptide (TPR) repeat protein